MTLDLRDGFSSQLYPVHSTTGSAQGLQMVLFIELESSKIAANVLEARFPLYPLQNSGPEGKPKLTQVKTTGILNTYPG